MTFEVFTWISIDAARVTTGITVKVLMYVLLL